MRLAALGSLTLVMALAACSWGPGTRIGKPVLTDTMIESLIPGQTAELTSRDKSTLIIYYDNDGLAYLRGQSPSGVNFRDNGLWSIESDRLCTRWRDIRGGRKVCEWIATEADSISFYEPQGSFAASGRVVQGDPYKLRGTR